MFADSLLDSAWADHSQRRWITLASFAAQSVGLGILLLAPLLYTQGLPKLKLMLPLLAPPAPTPGPPPVRTELRSTSPVSASNMIGEHLRSPGAIPHQIAQIDEMNAPRPPDLAPGFGVPWGTGERGPGSVLNSIANSAPLVIPAPPPRRTPQVSAMMEGNLVRKVQPEYPAMARAARIQGTVILRAIISKDGRITNLRLESGHPMLVKAAIDAVTRWRYRPYYLNGQPVEVETQVTVKFTLTGG